MDSNSSSEDECIALLAMLENDSNVADKSDKRLWVHSINAERKEYGEYYTLMPELEKDPKRFYIYFRMNYECFVEILELIPEDISKQITNFREPIPPKERLVVTLREPRNIQLKV